MKYDITDVIKKYHIENFFEDISKFIPHMKCIIMPKGTFLYGRPEHQRYVYFLLKGKLQVYVTMADGRQMLVWYKDSFVFLGDMELLGHREMTNRAETVTECIFLAIDVSVIKEELMSDRKFLRFLCNGLAEKITHLAKEQFRNRANTPREKMAIYLLQCADETGYFRENLKKATEILAISYRHIHRILGQFLEEGILERKHPGYQILDMQKLHQIAEEES